MTAASLEKYRTHHRIEVDRSSEWDRCDTCGVRVHMNLNRTWRHDPSELRQLELEAARVAGVISIASAPLRRFERPIVIEDHGAYVVTADLEDEPPAHNHFDIWDGTESCPRCAYETLRAEG